MNFRICFEAYDDALGDLPGDGWYDYDNEYSYPGWKYGDFMLVIPPRVSYNMPACEEAVNLPLNWIPVFRETLDNRSKEST